MRLAHIWVFFVAIASAVSISRAQNVVTDWNTIASRTIVAQSGKPANFAPFFAYTSIAVYDAVNSIHGRFRPFYFAGVMDRNASDEAAAISAAHAVLVRYFPAQKAELDGEFQESLGKIVARSGHAKQAGVEAGEAAADALITARIGDGLEADIPYVPGTEPGNWQPTPKGFLTPAVPWLGQMRPFTMKSPSQFLPPRSLPTLERAVGSRLQSDSHLWRFAQHCSHPGANRNRTVLDRAPGSTRRTHLELPCSDL